MAVQAVKRGHIRLNGKRVKPSRDVKAGDRLRIVRDTETVEVTVLGIPARRGPAALSVEFFAESSESIKRREQDRLRRVSEPRTLTAGKPDKRTRRLLRCR